jgi:hypothetical protein
MGFIHFGMSSDPTKYSVGRAILLFGKVKIWGEVVEHEAGYRSQFGKIISLDYGYPELLEKFRKRSIG